MRQAVVKDGLVVNVIEAPRDWKIEGHTLVPSSTAGPGDSYANRQFTPAAAPNSVVTPREEYADATTDTKRIEVLAKHAGLKR